MKILHILSSNHYSGAENVVSQLITECKDTPYEMIYCSPDGQIGEALKERNIKFHPLTEMSVTQIHRAIQIIKPDLLHAHDMRASYLCSKVCDEIPIISHIHNNGIDARRLSFKTIGFLWATRKIKHIFWVSKSAMSDYYFRRLVSKKSSVLPNILDLESLNKRANEPEGEYEDFDIVYLGRLAYPKNPMRFVEIVNLIAKDKPTIKAAIIGTGVQAKLTQNIIEEYGLQNNVKMTGFVNNPLTILKRAKALVMTSFWEGTPMSSLEALGLGIPVFSTPVDGLRDLIINDFNGFLSESNEELSNKLIKLLNDNEYQKFLSMNALSTAKKHNDVGRYLKSIFSAYNKATEK